MKILVVAATEAEIAPFLKSEGHKHEISALITGVGMVATAYELTKALSKHKYDLVLQAGIAGSFDRNIALGSLVFINSDQYGDLGAEGHDKYIDIFTLGFLEPDVHPFSKGKLVNPLSAVHGKISLPQVSGVTINTISGNETTINARKQRHGAQVESMEGAAFHFVCLKEHVPFAQVRAISNYVEPRNKENWKIKEAIINLNDWLIKFIDSL
jgi:futalosine hydrolase